MLIFAAIIGLVPAMLMILGIISVFRAGIKLGRHKEQRDKVK